MTQHYLSLPSPVVSKPLASHAWFYLFLHLIDTALQPRSPMASLCSNLVSCSLPTPIIFHLGTEFVNEPIPVQHVLYQHHNYLRRKFLPGGISFISTLAPSLRGGIFKLLPKSATCQRKEMYLGFSDII